MKDPRLEPARRWDQMSLSGNYFVAGAVTGFAASWFSTPFELVKTTLQLDNISQKRFKGSWDCALTRVRENGALSLFRGHVTNLWREIAFCTIYFGLYDHMKEPLSHTMSPQLAIAVSGGTSGMLAWFCSFPLDVIKSRVQTAQPGSPAYLKSAISVGKELLETRGLLGFFRGVGPSILRAMFVSATRFSVYEWTSNILQSHFHKS